MNSFGHFLKITTFGESHGPMMGAILDGLPANLPIDPAVIAAELARRRPAGDAVSTSRIEPDEFQIVSGICDGKTSGAPLTILIPNVAQNSEEYQDVANIFRPGHGDFGWYHKYGTMPGPGGGRLSGRETVARVAAGAIVKDILKRQGINIYGYTKQIGPICAATHEKEFIEQNPYRLPDRAAARQAEKLITDLRAAGDTIGGQVVILAENVPAGWGSPIFDKLDAAIGEAMFSIGAIKGVLFGDGLSLATMRGSESNDQMGPAGPLTNHAGGTIGGLSNGAPIVVTLLVKAPPSIALTQKTINTKGVPGEITIKGRHDCCLCPRIIPVAEAMLALTLFDAFLDRKSA